MLRSCPPLLLLLGAALVTAADPESKPIPEIGPAGKVERLHTGFEFTEGPAVDSRGNVYFTDIPRSRIYRSDARGQLSTFLEDSDACNGLMFDARGRLLACQGESKRLIAIDLETKKVTALADRCDEKPFGTPNDLVIDREGGVYFTAPDTQSVYHVAAGAGGKAVRVLEKLARPNGVILSPDEKTLYVLQSGSAEVMAYPVKSSGRLGEGKVFCKLV